MNTIETKPPVCRCCHKAEPVLCYPSEEPHLAVCPDCCDAADHANGEHGHEWEYDPWERDKVCIHCGIARRCTKYWEDDPYDY